MKATSLSWVIKSMIVHISKMIKIIYLHKKFAPLKFPTTWYVMAMSFLLGGFDKALALLGPHIGYSVVYYIIAYISSKFFLIDSGIFGLVTRTA